MKAYDAAESPTRVCIMHTSAMKAQISAAARRLLRNDLDRLKDESTSQLLAMEPEYKLIGDRTLSDQMRKNISLTLLRVSGDPIPEELALAAYETGQLRAIQQVELSAVSRSFRIDLRVLWQAFLEDAQRQGIGDHSAYISELLRIWEAVEANITEMTEGYQITSERLKQQNSDLKVAAFQRLLTLGASSNFSAMAKQLSTLSFDPASPLICVVSELREPDYAELSIAQARLSQYGVTHYFGWHHQHLLGILQASDLNTVRLDRLLAELCKFRTGYVEVSNPKNLIDAIRNTRILVSAADKPGLHALRENWLSAIAHAEPTLIDALVDELFFPFRGLTDYVREELERVIEAFCSTNGTIAEIADATFRHRNTVRNRLAQVEELTGLHLHVPRDAALLALAFPTWKRDEKGTSTGDPRQTRSG